MKEIKNKQIKGIACTIMGGICWGFSGTCGQYLFTYQKIEPGWLTMVRMILAGIILIGISMIKKDHNLLKIWKYKRDIARLFAFSLCGLLISQYTYLTAISYSNAGTATVLQNLNPVMIMLLVCIAKKKLPNKIEFLCIIMALTGTFLIATHGNIGSLSISPKGLFWGIMCAIGAVLYSLIPGKIISKWGSMVVTGYAMLIGGIVFGFISGYYRKQVFLDKFGLFAVLAIAVIGTAMAYSLYLKGISEIGPVKASMLASVEPVAATLFSFLWMGTHFEFIDVIGFILILATVFLLSRKPKSDKYL